MARPAQFGDRLYLNAEEFAQRAKQIERGIAQGDQEAVGPFRFDFARRAFHQTSLIVDPPDGRLPAFTPEGTQRPMPRGTYGDGPLDWTTDFSSTSGASRAASSDRRCASSTATGPRFRRARASWRSPTR